MHEPGVSFLEIVYLERHSDADLGKMLISVIVQVYESQAEIAEAREEAEMLRLKLESAIQDAEEAQRQTAAAQSGLAAALANQAPLTSRETSPSQPSSAEVSPVQKVYYLLA